MIKHMIISGLANTWVAAGGARAQITEITIGDFASGWQACRDIRYNRGAQGPENNAESYMFFALLVDLWRNMGIYFWADGNRFQHAAADFK